MGVKTWSFSFREERRRRMFENRVLRKIFWTGKDGITGEWRRLLNGEIYELYCSPNTFRANE
jgi:hypothetical protein